MASPFITGPLVPVGMLNLIRASLGILPDSTFPENALAIEIAGAHLDRFFQMHLELKLILIPPFVRSVFICRVCQNVRPALEDHANDAERHAHVRNVEDHWAGRYTSRQPGFVGSVKWYWM